MRGIRITAAAGAALVALTACSPDLIDGGSNESSAATAVDLRQSDVTPPRSSVARMVGRVLPSVVNVRVTSLSLDVFGESSRQGQGSGVIIDEQGTIVTNAHVIQGAVEVTVVLNDDEGTILDGEVIGAVPESDLAVIDVDADGLRAIELGRSSPPRLNLGDSVVAIGFPLGLGGPTVTKGIVSGQNRNISVANGPAGTNRLTGMLQTDAAINPGNSGGALVNMAGQLVGINSAAASASAAENIGFAIALDSALPVIEEILSEPQERRAWLGVSVDDVSPILAAQLGLPEDTRGALVVDLFPGPARGAGIQVGDVIVRVGDNEIATPDDLTAALTGLAPGDQVEVELVSSAGTRTVELELAARPPAL